MSSSPDTSTRTTGAHRTHREARDRAAARALAQHPPAHYEPHLDGLFTYCLSVLCDHDAAIAALADALAFAERRGQRVVPSPQDRRAWLYALARWACLRKLADAKQKRQGTHATGRHADDARGPGSRQGPGAGSGTSRRHGAGGQQPAGAARQGTNGRQATGRTAPAAYPTAAASEAVQERRRRELAQLAWPEAAGTSPEQREALELAVRHRLAGHEVAAVLGMDLASARELLASAACEVERTRAALAVVETGGCPGVSALTGDSPLVLSAALRRELVRHVDDCPRCRRTAERAVPGRWPGASVTPAELPLLPAPRTALHVAMAHQPRARGAAPRFDRRGFPMDPKDRAARRDRLRARAVTTTVVATVVAAPVLALWAAYRGTPTGEGQGGPSATAREARGPGALAGEETGDGYENAGNARPGPDAGFDGGARPDVSVEVVSVRGAAGHKAGHLTVRATGAGDTTLVTLTASGTAPVRWSATTKAPWLYLSRASGALRPGESLTIKVYVDHLREPSGHWSARVAIAPAGAVVSIDGYGTAPGHSAPATTHPADPPRTTAPRPTPTRTAPTSPSSPTPSDPPPTPSGPTSSTTPTPTATGSSPSGPDGPSRPPDDDANGAPSPSDA
ncbi:BACON domain-containing protein [Streptomyces sp. NPDC003393]